MDVKVLDEADAALVKLADIQKSVEKAKLLD